MISDQLKANYASIKAEGLQLMAQGDTEQGILTLELAAQIATMHPILPSFVDEEIEQALQAYHHNDIGDIEYQARAKTVVFYNSQIADRGALTQQYLSFFIEEGYKVLFVVPYLRNTFLGKDILRTVQQAPNVTLCIPKGRTLKSKMRNLRRELLDFKAELTFIHLIPYDTIGFATFSNTLSSDRYYVVHNDHTFWLGKNCADYFLEFRDFGESIAIDRRGLKPQQIIRCSYYPIVDGVPFQGFPFDRSDKVVALVAANPYKFMMDPERILLGTVTTLLEKYPQLVVVIAGFKSNELTNYIKNNNLEGRLVYIGHRADFFALMSNIDIYINSFPLIGGLTTQYAALAGKPIVGYSRKEIESTNTAEQLLKHSAKKLTYTDVTDFMSQIDRLIVSKQLRSEFSEKEVVDLVTKEDFDKKIKTIISDPKKHVKSGHDYRLTHDDDLFLSYYMERKHDVQLVRSRNNKLYRMEKYLGGKVFAVRAELVRVVKTTLRFLNIPY